MSDPNDEMSDDEFEMMQEAAAYSQFQQKMESAHNDEIQADYEARQAWLEQMEQQQWEEQHGEGNW